MRKLVAGLFASVTIEPVVFLTVFGWSLISGAEITKKMILTRICSDKLNLTSERCDNSSADISTNDKMSLQEDLNNLLMTSQFISSVPGILYSLVAGGDDLFYCCLTSLLVVWNEHFIHSLGVMGPLKTSGANLDRPALNCQPVPG